MDERETLHYFGKRRHRKKAAKQDGNIRLMMEMDRHSVMWRFLPLFIHC